MQKLFDALRQECSKSVWEQAVSAARIVGTVTLDRESPESVALKVKLPDETMVRTVQLFPEDEDWLCDCKAEDGVCVHAAAAAIAYRLSKNRGRPLPSMTSRMARVEHAFTRHSGGLFLERFLVQNDKRLPLKTTLSALTSGRVDGPRVAPEPADLAVDVILGLDNRTYPLPERMARLLQAMAGCPCVTLDGAPVKASAEEVPFEILRLTERGNGFLLRLARAPGLDEVFQNGAALKNGVLHPLRETCLNIRERAEFTQGRVIPPAQKIELMTSILPELRSRIHVEADTEHLPKVSDAGAMIHFETALDGSDGLAVVPTLVYGNPPIARVVAGRLVALANEVPIRDELLEERLARRLERETGLRLGDRTVARGMDAIRLSEKIEAWSRIKGEGGATVGGESALNRFWLAPPLRPDLKVQGDDFQVSFDARDGHGRRAGSADPQAVMRAFRAGQSLVPLMGGGFAELPLAWLMRHGGRLADLLEAKSGRGELPACAIPDLARLCRDLDMPEPPRFQTLRPLVDDFAGLPPLPSDLDLRAQLRGYQETGIRWLLFLKKAGLGALLADDMGLGKTLQTLAVLEKPSLVVAPTSVIHNWAAEAARFRPGLKVSLFHGPARRLDPDADVTVTSYALLRNELAALKAQHWKVVLLDEAQAIKNPSSQAAQAAFALKADFRVALTGTPVENRLDELWSEMNFAAPGLLAGRSDFDERYAQPIASGQAGCAAALRERLRPFVLRRLKRDVAAELPPRTETVLRCELSEDEMSLYLALRAATRRDVMEKLGHGGSVMAALEALLRMRQACCHPALIPGGPQGSGAPQTSSKVSLLIDKLTELSADGHRALVFSQWTRLLDLMEPELQRAGLEFVRLDGGTRDRAEVVRRFQSQDGPPVMLVSLKAGGTGLNLTAADHVFLVDPWWNPAVEDQAADRAHRIGQTRPVFIHRLVALGTVEEKILALQQEKRALAEAALSGASQAGGLTREDLLRLLDD